MFSFLNFTLVTICIPIFLLSPISSTPTHPRPFKKVYVFGDSYTDTGNTNDTTGPAIYHHISSLPYGRTFFHRPSNRYSDGRLVIDFVAEALNLPYFPPYLNKSADTTHGVNFAVGGCTAIPVSYYDENNVTSVTAPQSLPSQLAWFKDYIKGSGCKDAVSTPEECKAVFDGALVWFGEIGANDYTNIARTNITSTTVRKLAIKYEIEVITELLKMGAKSIVVQGLPTTGCFPLSFKLIPSPTERDEMGCSVIKNKESYEHNILLKEKIHNLGKKFPSTVIVYGDDWHAYREIYGNPKKYGFTERFRTCCGSGGGEFNFIDRPWATCGAPGVSSCKHPSRYMSWDGLHVTEGLSRVVSKFFLDGEFAQPPFTYLLKKATESRVQ